MSNTNLVSTRCGRIAIVGRPNVGKSTLMNHILGQKISIVTRKPQTTREQILGIKTEAEVQAIYLDTPGLHKNFRNQLVNRLMNRAASAALEMADVVLFLISALEWQKEDEWILEKLRTVTHPVILVINKIDRVKNKDLLLPFIAEQSAKYAFTAVLPISARSGKNLASLEESAISCLPERPHEFSADEITDRSQRFLITDMIREKIMRWTGQEIPYTAQVEIESYKEEKEITRIEALISVQKPGHKKIVIGTGGQVLKKIGQEAREEIEKLIGQKVFLKLFVKVVKP